MNVLHLEDSDLDAELTARSLASSWPECRVQRASTRDEFQSALQRGGFDLILSDYTMCGFEGLAALDLSRVYCPERPFIFFSGTIGEERAIDAIKRGATDYVSKDRPARLVPVIRQALARAEELRHHRETEEALRQTREHFRHIAENVTDIIMMSDLAGRRLYCNPAYYACVGREPDPSPAVTLFSDLHEDDAERVREMFLETIETGLSRRMEYRLVRADQTVRCIEAQNTAVHDETGKIVKILVLARDITERNDTENRLRQQAVLLDQAQDAILVRDFNDHIIYWNQSAARIYGQSVQEAQDRPVAELWSEDIEQAEVARRVTLLSGEWMGEMRQRTKSGATLVMQSRWSRVSGADGRTVGFFVINTDITEKKRLEAHLLSAQRSESIGLLAGGVAHDINNLLVPVLCSAELLEPMISTREGAKLVSMIKSSAQYGAALVQQLLAFARGVPSQKAEVSLPILLNDLTKFVAQSLGPTIAISLSIPDDPRVVWADATQLKQVFMNLCINARDAMPCGGSITLSLHDTVIKENEAAVLADLKPGRYITVTVRDTGAGILPANLHRIFDPFFTTKEVGKGIGLGLAAVRDLVRSHQGTITVESEIGRGTTFSVHLPEFSPVPKQETASPLPIASPQGSGQGILLVDDEASLREVLSALLTSNGYCVYKAGSGDEALTVLQAHHSSIDLVLTDITMPGMDGFALIQNIRKQNDHLPIVAISGMTGTPFFEEKASELAVPFLAKPVSRDKLLSAVAAALGTPGCLVSS